MTRWKAETAGFSKAKASGRGRCTIAFITWFRARASIRFMPVHNPTFLPGAKAVTRTQSTTMVTGVAKLEKLSMMGVSPGLAKVFYDEPVRCFIEFHCFAFKYLVQDAQIHGGANNGDDKQFVVEKQTLELICGSHEAFVAHVIKPSLWRNKTHHIVKPRSCSIRVIR